MQNSDIFSEDGKIKTSFFLTLGKAIRKPKEEWSETDRNAVDAMVRILPTYRRPVEGYTFIHEWIAINISFHYKAEEKEVFCIEKLPYSLRFILRYTTAEDLTKCTYQTANEYSDVDPLAFLFTYSFLPNKQDIYNFTKKGWKFFASEATCCIFTSASLLISAGADLSTALSKLKLKKNSVWRHNAINLIKYSKGRLFSALLLITYSYSAAETQKGFEEAEMMLTLLQNTDESHDIADVTQAFYQHYNKDVDPIRLARLENAVKAIAKEVNDFKYGTEKSFNPIIEISKIRDGADFGALHEICMHRPQDDRFQIPFVAIKRVMKKLISTENVGLDDTNISGNTPLMESVKSGFLQAAIALIELECDVNIGGFPAHTVDFSKDNQRSSKIDPKSNKLHKTSECTALMYAVLISDVVMVKTLLEVDGIEVDKKDSSGKTALMHVLRNAHSYVPSSFKTRPRFCQTEEEINESNKRITKLLIEKGADVNSQDTKENTPLHYALHYKSPACSIIIEKLKDLASRGDEKSKKNLNGIMKQGFNVYIYDEEIGYIKTTPLIHSIYNGVEFDKITLQLIDAGSDIFLDTEEFMIYTSNYYLRHGTPALHAFRRKEGTQEQNKALASKILEIENNDENIAFDAPEGLFYYKKPCSIHIAARLGSKSEIEFLQFAKTQGMDYITPDHKGRTPLMYAAATLSKNPQMLKFLLENGASVNERDFEGKTPLMHAVLSKNYGSEIVEAIVQHEEKDLREPGNPTKKTDLLAKTNNGYTAAMLCAMKCEAEKQNNDYKRGNSPNYRIKLKTIIKAEENRIGEDGRLLETTSLHIAIQNGDQALINELLINGASLFMSDKDGNTPLMLVLQSDQFSFWEKSEITGFMRVCFASLQNSMSFLEYLKPILKRDFLELFGFCYFGSFGLSIGACYLLSETTLSLSSAIFCVTFPCVLIVSGVVLSYFISIVMNTCKREDEAFVLLT